MTGKTSERGTTGAVTREFGTGLLHTTVAGAEDGGYLWRRRNGDRAPAPFVPADPRRDAVIGRLDTPGPVRWAVGVPEGAERLYRARGPVSVAGRLLQDGPDDEVATALHGLGGALRVLHTVPAPEAFSLGRVPRGLVRLTDWLAGRSPIPRAAYAESFLRPRLGDQGLETLIALCDRMQGRPDDADTVLCHGAPALGALVQASSGAGGPGAADMLIGEDLCLAPWRFDVGWTLGELVELRWYRGGSQAAWTAAVDAFLEGYGRDLGDAWRQHAALRVLLHLHDYTAYVGWDPKTLEKYIGFVKFLLGL